MDRWLQLLASIIRNFSEITTNKRKQTYIVKSYNTQ